MARLVKTTVPVLAEPTDTKGETIDGVRLQEFVADVRIGDHIYRQRYVKRTKADGSEAWFKLVYDD